jgi:DNA-binding MarR family transcriptional regulator
MHYPDLHKHPAVRAGLPPDRVERLLGLELAVRKTTGQSTLLSEAISRRFGMTSSDLECLDLVCAHGELTAGQLAEASGLSTGAITGVVDRLERSGYVRRERDPVDRRRVVIRMEALADEHLGPCYEEMQQGFVDLCSDYSDQELDLLHDFFRRCSRLGSEALEKFARDPAAHLPGPARER